MLGRESTHNIDAIVRIETISAPDAVPAKSPSNTLLGWLTFLGVLITAVWGAVSAMNQADIAATASVNAARLELLGKLDGSKNELQGKLAASASELRGKLSEVETQLEVARVTTNANKDIATEQLNSQRALKDKELSNATSIATLTRDHALLATQLQSTAQKATLFQSQIENLSKGPPQSSLAVLSLLQLAGGNQQEQRYVVIAALRASEGSESQKPDPSIREMLKNVLDTPVGKYLKTALTQGERDQINGLDIDQALKYEVSRFMQDAKKQGSTLGPESEGPARLVELVRSTKTSKIARGYIEDIAKVEPLLYYVLYQAGDKARFDDFLRPLTESPALWSRYRNFLTPPDRYLRKLWFEERSNDVAAACLNAARLALREARGTTAQETNTAFVALGSYNWRDLHVSIRKGLQQEIVYSAYSICLDAGNPDYARTVTYETRTAVFNIVDGWASLDTVVYMCALILSVTDHPLTFAASYRLSTSPSNDLTGKKKIELEKYELPADGASVAVWKKWSEDHIKLEPPVTFFGARPVR